MFSIRWVFMGNCGEERSFVYVCVGGKGEGSVISRGSTHLM